MIAQITTHKMRNPSDADSPRQAGRRHRQIALGLAAAFMLTPALALDVEMVGTRNWPGHLRGPAKAVAVQGEYAYVAADTGGLIIVDIHDPAHPQVLGGHVFGVAVAGNYAYAAAWHAGLQVIDIRDPAKPQRVGGGAVKRVEG